MNGLFDHRILFVGGKGGVGKTVTAAALALQAAEAGRKCLLVSTDPAHSLSDVLDRNISDRETVITRSLAALEIDPAATAKKYLASVSTTLRRFAAPAMYDEIRRHLQLAETAPGALEAALLQRLAEIVTDRSSRHDLVIFDTAPTGHTLQLLTLPEVMTNWIGHLLANREQSGKLGAVLGRLDSGAGNRNGHPGQDPVRQDEIREILLKRQALLRQTRRILRDVDSTAFILVLNPEKLAILETLRAIQALRSSGMETAALVVNRVIPETADGSFVEQRRKSEQQYLEEIRQKFRQAHKIYLPLFPGDLRGIDILREAGRMLTEQFAKPVRRPAAGDQNES